jgi:hypothetical protein
MQQWKQEIPSDRKDQQQYPGHHDRSGSKALAVGTVRAFGQAGENGCGLNRPYADQKRDEYRPQLQREVHGMLARR